MEDVLFLFKCVVLKVKGVVIICADSCARSRYIGQGQVITFPDTVGCNYLSLP